MSALVVTAAGPLSSLQDGGRWGNLRNGVTPAGAMDMIALVAANVMAGNAPTEAAIEFTLAGDSFEVDAESVRLAVAGDAAITLNDAPATGWRSFTLKRGDRLRIGALRSGARGYVAIAGGVASPPQLGSRSVHARSGLGGGPLRAGDRIPLGDGARASGGDVAVDPATLPYLPAPIRVVLGPQEDRFTAAGLATFLDGEYSVTAEADRMGYRLDGPEIEHRDGFNTISDAILTGSIQVPGTRKPIVLMADRQTTGGYPKIATTATASLPTLAQLKPGDRLRFAAVSADEARDLLRAQVEAIRTLPARLQPLLRDPRDLPSELLLATNLITGVVGPHD
ncbi:MAG: biotin-dependent carboxyltransferase family protein [Alphaproteobacteria bacterium]|nr:biotin-dependent carboxyltransferase family protein [Alphaproteobacteria bacterium]